MLHITIKSYDERFDTFACYFEKGGPFEDGDSPPFESLIPATLLPYIAPELCGSCDDLPYDLVGQTITLHKRN